MGSFRSLSDLNSYQITKSVLHSAHGIIICSRWQINMIKYKQYISAEEQPSSGLCTVIPACSLNFRKISLTRLKESSKIPILASLQLLSKS